MVRSAARMESYVKVPTSSAALKPASGGSQQPSVNTGDASAKSQAQEDVSKAVKDAAKQLRRDLQEKSSKVSVSVDKTTDRFIVRYKDPKSGKVVQQLPPEGILKMLRQIRIDTKGMVLDSHG